MMEPITVVHTGRRGRPMKVIDKDFLEDATSARRKLSIAAIAKSLKLPTKTVRRNMTRHEIVRAFDDLSDEDLDLLVRTYKIGKPTSGNRFVAAFLRTENLRIQQERVRNSVARVDGLGQTLRYHDTIYRREYKTPRSNHLWHCDGHHKLILWGIVIHGSIDGHDHTVSFSCLTGLVSMRQV